MSSGAESGAPIPPSYDELAARLVRLEQELQLYRHRYEELHHKLFGRKSEQRHVLDPKQEILFEAGACLERPASREEFSDVAPHKRRKRSKKEVPSDLPLSEHVYAPRETHCEACGEELEEYSRDVRDEVEFQPSRFFKRRHITVHCSCPKCKRTVSGTVPVQHEPVIPGAQVGPGFLAHLMVSKFCDHLPYYRQSQMYEREGVFFPDKTLSSYGMEVGRIMEPVAKQIKGTALSLDYLQADETRLRVLDHEKEQNAHTGQLWVMKSPGKECPLVVYEYHEGRGKEDAREFLGTFTGALQTDALASYNEFSGIRLGCMSHGRRKFREALKVSPSESAHVLRLIGHLYKIEAELKSELPKNNSGTKIAKWFKKREKVRKEKALPILLNLHSYLKQLQPKCLLEQHPLTKAVGYMLNRFYQFCVYVTDGRFEIDNNSVEHAIRSVAIGRNNWMFCGSHQGARMAAVMMTVIQTCKLRGINPQQYLADVLPRLASRKTTSLEGLSPLDWKN